MADLNLLFISELNLKNVDYVYQILNTFEKDFDLGYKLIRT
jgi:hypothetical protein